jgi:hypothetical protein
MGVFAGPEINESGLVLALDAGNPKSYPGSGTTWTDLSGRGNTGTLTNGPTYSSANGGYIVFDGTDDYAVTAATSINLTGNHTICGFISPGFASSSNVGSAIFDFSNSDGSSRSYLRWENSSLGFYWDMSGGPAVGARTTSSPSFNANSWIYVCLSYTYGSNAQMYINGNPVSTTQINAGNLPVVANQSIKIGFGVVNNYYWNGKISIIQLYTRALSAAEISQNFNALRGRFGI